MSPYEMCGWAGFVIEVSSLWMAGKEPYGWLLAALGAIFWIPYAIGEQVWPSLASTILFGGTYVRNWMINRRIEEVHVG